MKTAAFFFLLIFSASCLFADTVQVTEKKTTTETAASVVDAGTASDEIRRPKPVFSYWEDAYEGFTGNRPLDAVREVQKQAAQTAKSLGRALSEQIKNKQIQEKQKQLLQRFDLAFVDLTRGLKLNGDEREHLLLQVEKAYIDDFDSGRNALDQTEFRDLPDLVQKGYGEIEFARTVNGKVDTYYLTGEVKTRWNFKNGQLDGAVITYYRSGEMKFIDIYKDGQRVNRKKYDPEGKMVFDQSYTYDVPPPAPVPAAVPEAAPATVAVTVTSETVSTAPAPSAS